MSRHFQKSLFGSKDIRVVQLRMDLPKSPSLSLGLLIVVMRRKGGYGGWVSNSKMRLNFKKG